MPDALSDAKSVLSHAQKAFPTTAVAAPAPTVSAPKTAAPSIGQELAAKKTMVDKARSVLPKMHNGGTIKVDGGYDLKAGEHVLTAAEAKKARKHALIAAGMKSLARPGIKETGGLTTDKTKGQS